MTRSQNQNGKAAQRISPRPLYLQLKPLLKNAVATGAVTPELRGVIRQMCEAQDRARIDSEDFLSAFRSALVEAAIVLGISPGHDRNELLSQVVSVCVDELRRS